MGERAPVFYTRCVGGPLGETAALTPAQHLLWLHPPGWRGARVAIAQRCETRWRETVVSEHLAEDRLQSLAGQADVFVSMQKFNGGRVTRNLARLHCIYVDLDFYKVACWQGVPASDVAAAVVSHLDGANLPFPDYIVSSGRGLQVVWLHQPVPASVLPRWQATENHFVAALSGFGADTAACDPCRVFRVAGTLNAKSQTVASMVYLSPQGSTRKRRSFEIFANAILPHTIRDRRRRRPGLGRTAGSEATEAGTTKQRCTYRSYHEAKIKDLEHLAVVRGWDKLPAGQRDLWLFHVATSLCWLHDAASAWKIILETALTMGGWSAAETKRRMSAVKGRAVADAKSGSANSRHRVTAARCVADLNIKPSEMREAGLRVLVDADVRRERTAERQIAFRRRRGAVPRADYLTCAEERNIAAWQAKQNGASWQTVAVALQFPSADAARKAASRAKTSQASYRTSPLRCMGGVATCAAAALADPVKIMVPRSLQPGTRMRLDRQPGADATPAAARGSDCEVGKSVLGLSNEEVATRGGRPSPQGCNAPARSAGTKQRQRTKADPPIVATNLRWLAGEEVGLVCPTFGRVRRAAPLLRGFVDGVKTKRFTRPRFRRPTQSPLLL